MGFDAGSISARAELDLTAFQQSLAEALEGLDQLDAALQAVGAARVTLDTALFTQQAAAAEADIAALSAALTDLPEATASVNAQDLHDQVQTAQAELDTLSTTLLSLPTGQADIDSATLEAHVQAAQELLAEVGDALQAIPPGEAVLDTEQLGASIQEALSEIASVTAALEDLPPADVTLTTETLAEQAGAAEDTLQRLSEQLEALPPGKVALDTADMQRQTQQATQQIQQVSKAVESIPKGKVEVDTAPARTAVQQISALLDGLRARAASLPLVPRLDVGQLRTGVGEATRELGILDNTAGKLAGIGIGAAAIGVLAKSLFDLGRALDDVSDRLTVATGAMGDDLEELQGVFENLARSTPNTFENISEALAILNPRLDITGEALQSVANDVLELSRVTGSNLPENARAAGQAFVAWGVAAEDTTATLDQALRVYQRTGATVTELLQGVAQGAPIFQGFGLSISQSLALLGLLEKSGLDATTAMVGLRQAFTKFTEAGADPAAGLKELLDLIRTVPDDSTAASLALAAFGPRVAQKLVPALREGRLAFEDLAATIRTQGDTIAGAGARIEDGAEKFRVALNNFSLAAKPLAADMFNLGTSIVQAMQAAGGAIDGFLQGAGQRILNFRQTIEARSIAAQAIKAANAPQPLGIDVSALEQATPLLDAMEGALERARVEAEALNAATAEIDDAAAPAVAATQERVEAMTNTLNGAKDAAFDLGKALAAAGTDETAIANALDFARATEQIDQALRQLDPAIAAEIAALRNWANGLSDAEERHRELSATAERAGALIRQQADIKEQAAQADRVAAAAASVLADRYTALANAALPALSRQETELVQALLAGGDAAGAASVALGALGIDLAQVEAGVNGTGQAFAKLNADTQKIAEAADVAANAFTLQEAAAGQMLQTLTQGLPAAEQAWVQYVAATQGTQAALRQVYERMGGDLAEFDQASERQVRRLVDRLAQAREAARVFREEGRLLPAPEQPDLFRTSNQAIAASRVTLNQFLEDQAIALQRAAEQATSARAAFQAQAAAAEAAYEDALQGIQARLHEARAAIAEQRGQVLAEYARVQSRLEEDLARRDARRTRDILQQDAEALRSLREQAGDLLVGAASEFHGAAARAIDDLFGLSGSALRQAASQVVDRFAGVSDAARQANRQITDAQQTMLDRVRDTFDQINSEASSTLDRVQQMLSGAAARLTAGLGGVLVNLPGQGSPEQQAALQATNERNEQILRANLQKAAESLEEQKKLREFQQKRDALDKAGLEAEKDFNTQMVDLAQQARDQRAQMITQLERMVQGFQRSAFQTVQGRTDETIDDRLARTRAQEDSDRALSAQLRNLNQQLYQAFQTSLREQADARRALQQTLLRLDEQQRAFERQERQRLEDANRAERRARERHEEVVREQRRLVNAALAIVREAEGIREDLQRRPGQEFDFHENVFMDPAAELMERVAQRWQEAAAAGVG